LGFMPSLLGTWNPETGQFEGGAFSGGGG